jgi:hypothetical protein
MGTRACSIVTGWPSCSTARRPPTCSTHCAPTATRTAASATPSHALVQHGLLDELRLWIQPLLVGKGRPADLLYRDSELRTLELVDTTPLKSGIVILSYAAAR